MVRFPMQFKFDIKHMKGKENKVANAHNRKFHVAAINSCQTDLRAKIIEAATNDKFSLQAKEKLLANPVKRK